MRANKKPNDIQHAEDSIKSLLWKNAREHLGEVAALVANTTTYDPSFAAELAETLERTASRLRAMTAAGDHQTTTAKD